MTDPVMPSARTLSGLRPVAIVVALAASWAIGATATPASAATCRAPSGATAVYRGTSAIVYRRARPSFQGTASYWGCLTSSGRRTTLPGSSAQRTLSSFRSAGRFLAFVAYEDNFHDQTASVAIRVFDLRARKPRRGIVLNSFPGSHPDRLRLSRLILTATGTAAWRQTGRMDRIAARDVHGKHVVLASAPRGSLSDLVLLRGTTAQWRNGNKLERRRLDRLGR